MHSGMYPTGGWGCGITTVAVRRPWQQPTRCSTDDVMQSSMELTPGRIDGSSLGCECTGRLINLRACPGWSILQALRWGSKSPPPPQSSVNRSGCTTATLNLPAEFTSVHVVRPTDPCEPLMGADVPPRPGIQVVNHSPTDKLSDNCSGRKEPDPPPH